MLAFVVTTSGCAKVSDIEWESPVARGHPLVGRIWDVRAAAFIGERTLIDRLAASRYILLGERHDNPDHHALQARLVRELSAAGRRPAVGFEMFSTDDSAAIARYLVGSPKDAAGLGDAVNWKRSGWPDWRVYQPIAQAALDASLPIVGTNLSRAATDALRRNGLAGLGPTVVTQLKLDAPPSPATRATMAQEIRESHCGQAPEGQLDRMVDIQWARDARIAEALARAGRADGAVLI
ncbi:MAG: ChaN family lipoprotein, partial [Candidatus Rokuibacteriota bacterium]